ncbi:hypothetical protein [Chromobacterium violaceum]|uniref:Uncharacterized protein n=1 Tax=Chromobacterium violaceum (strain ATCC 12472 / DSM 30191 / JCM 1249 / CCUG 213 / NBRC 12614 / NCIMB 9131 / NCTC 9757 / MK) TaxID=243365 RepID=Q7NXZ7_CHRVO|nr:hypothetical protein [Chromobacterium violaceum]AAQ59154.1 conserved hypothetical protein [Chromobacterium violaceum ATCC 12472]SUX88687.1 Uncharacterised protein [Chromobacterium violaceum]
MNKQHRLFQIFKTGTFGSMGGTSLSFSEGDLQMTASAYNPQRYAAPLVIGHPQDDKPVYGKVTGLFVKDGGLYAQAISDSALETLVKAGRYRKISASFFPPWSSNNPTPGAYSLKHVGFLGAMPPAVKGMANPEFAEMANSLCFSEGFELSKPATAAFAEFSSQSFEQGRAVHHQLTLDYQQTCPALSYMEAATLAERVLNF